MDDLDLDLETEEQKINRNEQRFTKILSEKATITTEKEAEKARADKAEAEKQAALKEVDFFKNFTQVTSKYTGATEYQDQIREKVMAGYTMEDATVSILAKEGKYTPQVAAPLPKESPAGGSAVNTITGSGDKPVAEMTRDEKLSQLKDAEARGDLGLS